MHRFWDLVMAPSDTAGLPGFEDYLASQLRPRWGAAQRDAPADTVATSRPAGPQQQQQQHFHTQVYQRRDVETPC